MTLVTQLLYFFYSTEDGPNWYLITLVIALSAFAGGFYFVSFLRERCKSSKQAKGLTVAVFAIPILVFIICNILAFFVNCRKLIFDAISFGTVAGILIQLSIKPKGRGNVKLIVYQINAGKTFEVWLDSIDATVGEVISKIAQTLEIQNANRINIESGKGYFLDDMNQTFSSLVDDVLKSMDFFGFVTMSCFIFVKEEDVNNSRSKRVSIVVNEDVNDRDKKNNFLQIFDKQIRYGDQVQFTAKIAAAVESRAYFTIACVDKFAAAAPSTIQFISQTSLRIHNWQALIDANGGLDGKSDIGGGDSSATASATATATASANSGGAMHASNNNSNKSIMPRINLRKKKQEDYVGKPVCDGDTIVLECNGKYVTIYTILYTIYTILYTIYTILYNLYYI
jgi:hypothetical protein